MEHRSISKRNVEEFRPYGSRNQSILSEAVKGNEDSCGHLWGTFSQFKQNGIHPPDTDQRNRLGVRILAGAKGSLSRQKVLVVYPVKRILEEREEKNNE